MLLSQDQPVLRLIKLPPIPDPLPDGVSGSGLLRSEIGFHDPA